MRWLPITLLLVVPVLACSHLSGGKAGKTADQDFEIAMSYFKDQDWVEAQAAFDRVRLKYPYSKFAALAELRSADTKYAQERFIEAAEAYRHFVQMHPGHEEVDFAALRIGEATWGNAPSRFFLLPPDVERDLADVRAAVTALEDFLQKYPSSKYRAEGQRVLADARGKLAEHEWYVAEFYRKRDRWTAVAGRLQGMLRDYPGTKHEPQALLNLAEAYLHLGDRPRAQQAVEHLAARYPQDPSRAEAEKLLAQPQ